MVRTARRVLASARAWRLWALALTIASAAAFLVPAAIRTAPLFPAPLDDTYIYFGHARSWALGHPFAWYPGNGYSSGATSVLYPLLLAPLWAVGFRASSLGLAAALLAVLFAFDLARSLAELCRSTLGRWLAPALVVAVPLLGWSWWSGMETALFGALLGRALLATERASASPPSTRGPAQGRLGLWLAALVLTRPEGVPLAFALAISAVYHARSLPTAPSLARTGAPAIAALALQALANRLATGEWSPAGAVRKLLWSDPSLEPARAVGLMVQSLLVLIHQAFFRALGGALGVLALVVVLALALRARTRLALPLLVGNAGALALVLQNATARFQNYRYAAPCLLMIVAAACLGIDHAASRRRHATLAAAAFPLIALALVALPLTELPAQIRHFALASQNIADQHGAVAKALRAIAPRRVFVNDAGAIPYLAEVAPLDGLGLGGFRGLPFARASAISPLCVIELIERLPADDRPDVLAIYPGWWPGVPDVFGTRIDAVRIEHNVICAAEEKVLYSADWSLLTTGSSPPDTLDTLDVADLVSERAHALRHTAHAIVARVLELPHGASRWDAGRTLPAEHPLSFRVDDEVTSGPAILIVRGDDGPERPTLSVEVTRDGRAVATHHGRPPPPTEGRWRSVSVPLDDLRGGDRIEITSQNAPWRTYL
ncbi:MAG: hypothetical protein RIF41_02335, partial [Polyangiaceae bacterium]